MHEMSVAAALVEQLQRIAVEQHAVRITELEVQCGVMQQIVPEALQLAFEAASMDTPAAGAKLRIVEAGLAALCRGCGEQFQAAIDDYRCPRCQQADVELTSGRDILLRTVVCETRGEVA